MAVGWTWAFDTPFKWTKQIASHFGGTRQGMASPGPNRIKDAGGIRHQFHHVIDIVPTILEVDRHPGASGERDRPETDRRREHGLYLRQGQCRCTVHAHHAIFRNVRQPRHLSQGLVRLHHAACGAFAAAEIYQVDGQVHLAEGDRSAAEASFHRAIDVARLQEAKSWELRACTSLARLWADAGQRGRAYALLARWSIGSPKASRPLT